MNATALSAIMFVLSLILCPLLYGIINRVKAIFAGRKGPPLLQKYYDLRKLLGKDSVYSTNATWLFPACAVAVPAAGIAAAAITPFGPAVGLLTFQGDFIVWAGAFTLARVIMILAALDVGSSFEGMGASREAWYSVLAEPAIYLAMVSLAVISQDYSLSGFFHMLTPEVTTRNLMALIFAATALFLVSLSENARIPVDDPTTHLELTMIHEVMILDHSGPDLAFIEYGAALKLWVMGAIFVGAALPVEIGTWWQDSLCFLGAMALYAILIGIVESVMARLKLIRVPQYLLGALSLATLSVILVASAK